MKARDPLKPRRIRGMIRGIIGMRTVCAIHCLDWLSLRRNRFAVMDFRNLPKPDAAERSLSEDAGFRNIEIEHHSLVGILP